MAVITVTSITIQNWQSAATSVELRLYLDRAFVSSSSGLLQAGSPPSGLWYKKIACTVDTNNRTITIPAFTIDSTRDGQDLQTARYSAWFFNSSSGQLITPFQGFEGFQIPEIFDTGTTCTWAQIREFNAATIPAPSDQLTYSRTEIDAKIANAVVDVLDNPMTSQGDLIVGAAGGVVSRLGKGAEGTYLKATATTLAYGSVTGSDVTAALGYTPVAPTRAINTASPLTGGGTLSSDLTISFSAQSGNKVLASPSDGSSGTPAFRALVANDIPSIPASKINTVLGLQYGGLGVDGTTASNGQIMIGGTGGLQLAALTAGSGISISNGDHSIQISNAGVTSVALSMPSIFSVSGSPVTTSGTLTASLANQSANLVFAGPSSGAAGAPTFRALVANDIPSLDFSKITTGIVPLAQGGLGQSYTATAIQDGDLLIGHDANNNFSKARLTAGSGINIINGAGTITIEATTGGGGTVTSVGLSMPSIFSVSGSPVTTSGTLTASLANQSANLVFAGPSSGAAGAPTFRALVSDDIPNLAASKITSGTLSAARGGTGLDGSAAANGQLPIGNGAGFTLATLTAGSGISITNGTGSITIASTASGGTVTSVGLSMPSIFSVSGSPVTTSGTLTASLANQSANLVFAGPSSGAAGAPTFRALVSDDIPNLAASKITSGTLSTARGGTGVDGSAAANGQLLIGNGAGFTLATLTAGSGISITNGAGSISITNTGATAAWSALTAAAANLSLDMNNFTTTMTWDQNTGTSDLFTLQDFSTNTGTGYIFHSKVVAGSSAKPFKASSGATVAIDTTNTGNVILAGQAVTINATARTIDLAASTSGKVTLQAASTTTDYTITLPSQAPTTSNQVAVFSNAGAMTFSDALALGAGSESAPTYAFNGDLNTGIYSSAADTLDITTGGARKLSLGASTIQTLASFETNAQAALVLNPYGTGAGQTGEVRFKELAANGSAYVGFKAPDSLASNTLWVLPTADGSNGQVLQTNGAGVLSWVTPAVVPTPGSAAYVFLEDEFLRSNGTSADFGEYRWAAPTTSSGTPTYSHSIYLLGNSKPRIGIISLQTGTSSGNNCTITPTSDGTSGSSGTMLQFGALGLAETVPWRMECVFRTPISTANVGVYIGFTTDTSNITAGLNGMYLRYDTNSSDTQFMFVTRNTTTTATSSGVTPAVNTWYKVVIFSDTAGQIKFSLNDDTVVTHTTTVPTSVVYCQLGVITRTTQARAIAIDYWSFYSKVNR